MNPGTLTFDGVEYPDGAGYCGDVQGSCTLIYTSVEPRRLKPVSAGRILA